MQGIEDDGRPYTYHPGPYAYTTPVVNGLCKPCGNKGVVQRRTYTPDVMLGNGLLVEIKGKFSPEQRSFMRHFIKCNPDKRLAFLFQRDNWLSKKKARSYCTWADALGCLCAVGTQIPSKWWQ